jgi:hypothetical protein
MPGQRRREIQTDQDSDFGKSDAEVVCEQRRNRGHAMRLPIAVQFDCTRADIGILARFT